MSGRYINPFTDFGFKKLFGTEVNKDLLIDFLNTLLHAKGEITSLTYLPTERLGGGLYERKAIFDVYCENDRGEKFIVEMQKAEQDYFKDRSIFYSTFPIQEQAPRGKWDFHLNAVYTIGLLDFVFAEDRDTDEVMHHEIKLMDTESKKVFYDKLTFIYLEMPKFRKTEEELETNFDRWMFLLTHMDVLDRCPQALQTKIFQKAFEVAEIACYTPTERREYEESLKVYRDLVNVVDSAKRKGLKKGLKQGEERGLKKGLELGRKQGIKEGMKAGLEKVVRQALSQGLSTDTIITLTGLSADEIEKYRE